MAPQCFNLYIYNRQGACIHYQEWHRPKSVKEGAGSETDDQKQMFGLFWTLSNFCATMNPRDTAKLALGQPRKIGEGCRFNSFTANNYKLHFCETPSGLKFVLNTSRDVGDLRDMLTTLYNDAFVDCVIKSPSYVPGQPFVIPAFNLAVDRFLSQRGLLHQQ